jgi:ubiquinone/menaquinone biosynthesis C-methylase UbiE
MKIRESGMPDENVWKTFFNIELILRELHINQQINNLVEIGFGYGTFTIPVSKRIKGNVFAFDLDKDMVSTTQDKINSQKIKNIELAERDILKEKSGIANNSVDYVMLFNILHHDKPAELLDESYRILKSGGKVGIIHWRTDIETPRGPSLNIRSKPLDCVNWVLQSNFELLVAPKILEPYHFGLLAIKP